MTLGEWLEQSAARLAALGVDSAKLEAQVLAGAGLGWDRTRVLAHPDHLVDTKALGALLERRLNREPLAYIVRKREFFGRTFAVRPGVLIPRQETETLIEAALELPWNSCVDVGVGSGCIAITLKIERPGARLVGVDVSPSALEVARENAMRLGADVRLIESDLTSALATERFDLIVSNPPYVRRGDALPEEVFAWEPDEALYAEEDGLAFYRRLAACGDYLTQQGHLVMEVGDGMADRVANLLQDAGWPLVAMRRDLGGMPRVVVCQAPRSLS